MRGNIKLYHWHNLFKKGCQNEKIGWCESGIVTSICYFLFDLNNPKQSSWIKYPLQYSMIFPIKLTPKTGVKGLKGKSYRT